MQEIFSIILELSQDLGYLGIIILMTIESSFIPFPSEIVIPPAAYLASQGYFNIYLVVLSGVLGSLIGASLNYFLAITLGRKIVYSIIDKKIFRLMLLNSSKLKKAEDYFVKHGNISTLIGRFIPAIRQLISIPAGFSKMNFKNFCIFTGLGSGLWVIVLAVFGYVFGMSQKLGIILNYFKEISYSIIFLTLLIIVFYWLKNIFKKNKN